jgi:hypothetical protein
MHLLRLLASTLALLQGLLVGLVECRIAKRRFLAAARLRPVDLRPPGLRLLPNKGTMRRILARRQLIRAFLMLFQGLSSLSLLLRQRH